MRQRCHVKRDRGDKALRKKIFRGTLCEFCFYEELFSLNQEYENHRNAMIATVEKIKSLFKEDGDGSKRKKN